MLGVAGLVVFFAFDSVRTKWTFQRTLRATAASLPATPPTPAELARHLPSPANRTAAVGALLENASYAWGSVLSVSSNISVDNDGYLHERGFERGWYAWRDRSGKVRLMQRTPSSELHEALNGGTAAENDSRCLNPRMSDYLRRFGEARQIRVRELFIVAYDDTEHAVFLSGSLVGGA